MIYIRQLLAELEFIKQSLKEYKGVLATQIIKMGTLDLPSICS